MADEKKITDKWWKQHFIVKMKSDMVNGIIKFVEFRNGRGILDMLAIATAKPQWAIGDDKGGFKPNPLMPGWTLHQYVEYFQRRGATVEPITATAAKELRDELAGESVKFAETGAAHDTPAGVDPDGAEKVDETTSKAVSDPVEKAFACAACKHEFNAVDVGVSPIDCPKCGTKAATVRAAKKGKKDK